MFKPLFSIIRVAGRKQPFHNFYGDSNLQYKQKPEIDPNSKSWEKKNDIQMKV